MWYRYLEILSHLLCFVKSKGPTKLFWFSSKSSWTDTIKQTIIQLSRLFALLVADCVWVSPCSCIRYWHHKNSIHKTHSIDFIGKRGRTIWKLSLLKHFYTFFSLKNLSNSSDWLLGDGLSTSPRENINHEQEDSCSICQLTSSAHVLWLELQIFLLYV